ncbi:hypothetical protein [Geobacter sp. SVR]|uniref:hypothetical protein n=1 Tax=Geobacter sp. SVR TaxID=2495594 RepID=UPI00143F0528|nr:hypothetical protein [Geobacter sp. SVR]BCS54104.1 hypothetical protein GSVR_24120 [Geobacter sp. SVR]GCF87587.1 hypothetical protein GSbR_41870 [Geobacter sp. SVR]
MLHKDGNKVVSRKITNAENNSDVNSFTITSPSVVALRYKTDQALCDLFILKQHLDTTFPFNSIKLHILYMSYSRTGRQNDFYTFNLSYVGDSIVIDRYRQISERLERKGFTSTVSLLQPILIGQAVKVGPRLDGIRSRWEGNL